MGRKQRVRSLLGDDKDRLLIYYDCTCQYCGAEATVLDHVIPYEAGGSTTTDNLIASCRSCNAIAGGQVFASLDDKKAYVRSRIRAKKSRVTHKPPPPTPLVPPPNAKIVVSLVTVVGGTTYAVRCSGPGLVEVLGPLIPAREEWVRSHPHAWTGVPRKPSLIKAIITETIAYVE